MQSRLLALAILLVAGCSSSEASHPALPTKCNPSDRIGTYRVTYVAQAGDCGPLDSQLVSLNAGPMGAGSGCTLNSERLSEGDCKLERDVTCQLPSGGTVRTVGVTRAQTANASELAGTSSFTITGPAACNGTYAVDAVRQ